MKVLLLKGFNRLPARDLGFYLLILTVLNVDIYWLRGLVIFVGIQLEVERPIGGMKVDLRHSLVR